MRLGIFAKTFEGRDPLTVLRAVRQAGYTCCQYNMACSGLPPLPPEVSDVAVAAIRDAVAKSGVAISAMSATYNMSHPDLQVHKRGRAALKILCKVAAELKIPMVTLCTGSRNESDQWADHPDNHLEETFFQLCEEMEFAINYAEENGVLLGIEPEPGNVVRDATVAARFIKEMGSDCIKVVFDPANLIEGRDHADHWPVIAEALDLLGSEISLVHAKDRSSKGLVVPAGKGVVDFGRLFASLKEIGFSGDVVTHGLEAADAGEVSSFLRHRMMQAGVAIS